MWADSDTAIGGNRDRFPSTQVSLIEAAAGEPLAMERVAELYWKPVYKFIRFKFRKDNEAAKDLTQGFFANAFEKNYFATYDARKASFQTFLRTCLDGFVANERKAGQRLKRGGDVDHYQLDFAAAEHELAAHASSTLSPEDYFHREWVRWMFTLAVDAFRQRCEESGRTVHFQLFERYDLSDDDVSYASLAADFGLDTATVNNYLAAARRDFRRIVLDKLREITVTDEEFRTEARSLLGVEHP